MMGDGYVVVSGVPVARPDHAMALIQFGIEMLDAAAQIHDLYGHTLSIRIGIASGPVEHAKEQFEFESRGPIDVKGKGQVATRFVIDQKKSGCVPKV